MRIAPRSVLISATVAVAVAVAVGACGGDDGADDESTQESTPPAGANVTEPPTDPPTGTDEGSGATAQRFPDVVDATATLADDGTWRFDVTLSSPYDTPERYADAWRVIGDDGAVYGIRELTHDHANEQPFTRSLSGVELPGGIVSVTIEGRDQVYGWGGEVVVVPLDQG